MGPPDLFCARRFLSPHLILSVWPVLVETGIALMGRLDEAGTRGTSRKASHLGSPSELSEDSRCESAVCPSEQPRSPLRQIILSSALP